MPHKFARTRFDRAPFDLCRQANHILGRVDHQGAISCDAAEAVTIDVRKRVSDLGANGGYVIASSHNLAPDTLIEKILTLRQASRIG